MHNAELESRIMNAEMPKAEEDKLIQMCEDRLILRNTVEARAIINQLVQALKKNQAELNITEKTQKVNGNVIERAQEDNKEQKLALHHERELRVYYQKTLMKFLRDSQVMTDHAKHS
jgi:SOS response regulatory protein OraA/RecX